MAFNLLKGFRYEVRLATDPEPTTAIHLLTENSQEFEAAYRRAIWMELSPEVLIPICSYADLVKSKCDTGHSADAVDLHQLEMVRCEMTNPTLKKDDPWATCTFEGNELSQLVDWAALPFATKVARIEQMHAVSMAILKNRQRMGLRSILSNGEFV
jgi:hypothetical protein